MGEAERKEARIDAIAILVNLACADDNKAHLIQDENVMRTIIHQARYDEVDKVRMHATVIILNLSYAEGKKTILAKKDSLLSTLSHLMDDSSSFARRYATASLFALANDAANSAFIATYENGMILEALRILLLKEPSDESRISAAESIFIMTRSNSIATVAIANHHLLLDSMAEAVISDY